MDRLLREVSTQKAKLERKVASSVQKTMSDMGLPTKKDFQPILKRLDAMEKAIEMINNTRQGTEG
jgi:polyhydroxyalkanoate synthesis regulator phasin